MIDAGASRRHHLPTYEIDGDLYVIHVNREKLLRFSGRTRNARTIAAHDFVVWNNAIDSVYVEDDGTIVVQHPTAGIEHRLRGAEWLDKAVALFDEPANLTYGEVDEHLYGGESA